MVNWKTVSLGRVASFQNGEAFSSKYFNTERRGLRLVKNRDLKNDDQIMYYEGEFDEHFIVNDGDLLVGMDGDFTPVIWKKGKSLLNQRVGRVLVKEGATLQYIYYALFAALKELEHVTSATTVKHLSSKTCLEMHIPLPSLAEQRKIAEILRTWDEAIETAEAELSRLRERLVSLTAMLTLRQCVETPEQGWHDVKIGELLQEVDRDVEWDDAKTFSLISCGRRASGIFLREKKAGSDIDVKKMYEVQAGDFIVSQKQSAHAGWGMVTKEFHGHHVSPMYTIYGLKGKGLHMPFFNWLCKTPWMRHQAYLSSYGVHIEKMSFVSRLFLKTKIRIPVLLTDQEKACAVLESAESEIKAAALKLEKLNEQKRGLMQKLLTGEVRVAA